ncbi:uncharacterized protein LOC128640345 [Bombina bombina]|uniref:uncharacterized protein LOC128640345 n=1 Tax=Bombina bombina TaxID=8345 RepID=UPI00235A76BB|nr:uncharacterized protein LOC128640345 [Bombina bombina]
MGNVSYSSGNTEPFRTLLELRVSDTGTCWPENCAEKPSKGTEKDLGFTVTKPGHYLMVVWLKLGEKIKPFQRKVCLPRLIVSASPSVLITLDINTTIHCQTSCRITNGVLQWKHDREIRAERQEDSLPLDVTPHLVNMGIWTCILSIDKQTKMSENITLEIKPLVTLGSGMPFWLIVGASIFLLVVVVLSICLLRSHCRRKRLARRRVWLLQSLRQHRTCKCKRFSPELREIY